MKISRQCCVRVPSMALEKDRRSYLLHYSGRLATRMGNRLYIVTRMYASPGVLGFRIQR